jgi:hypothetical protein
MKLKSLLFGSAAVLAAGTGAQAADLPVAEPVEYVRICDAFGTGFYYIPGTDTCLRISGRVRVEAHYVDSFDDEGPLRELNNYTTRARGNLRLDARTQTDLGLVRAFFEYELTVGPGNFSDAPGSANYDDTGAALVHAYIQISNDMGTFTAGHTSSFYDFWGSNGFGTRVGIDDQTGEQTLFAYTFGGGNGFSATISLEDPASGGRRLEPGAVIAVDEDDDGIIDFIGDDNYEGQEMPDLVANIRVDQGWGSAQIMGVVRHIHDKDGFDTGVGPFPVEGEDDADEFGWSIGAGASVNFGAFGIDAQAGYADGALAYITTDPGGAGDWVPDADGNAQTNEAWMIRAGLRAEFTPTLSAYLDGSYTDVDSDADILDYQFWGATATLVWEPVSGLIMGPEIAYNDLDFDEDEGDDVDLWKVMFRIQRDF